MEATRGLLKVFHDETLSLPLSLSLSLTGEQGLHTLFIGQREREIKREFEREKVRKRERDKEGER